MEFIDQRLADYAEAHTTPESEVLAELNRETWAKVLMPRMLSGHLQGRVLSLFSKLQRPRRILEVGTYTGYSALCLAEGLSDDGLLHTIDINAELEDMVLKYVKKAGYEHKIKMHVGNALEIIPQLDETFDLVFIDADKENYWNYYEMAIDKVRPGGLIMADNVLWSGKVIDPKMVERDEETKALNEFNSRVGLDNRVEQILLPVRDGIMIARKR